VAAERTFVLDADHPAVQVGQDHGLGERVMDLGSGSRMDTVVAATLACTAPGTTRHPT
jgi:hypothetical protein